MESRAGEAQWGWRRELGWRSGRAGWAGAAAQGWRAGSPAPPPLGPAHASPALSSSETAPPALATSAARRASESARPACQPSPPASSFFPPSRLLWVDQYKYVYTYIIPSLGRRRPQLMAQPTRPSLIPATAPPYKASPPGPCFFPISF